jgi:hypothetical protein
MIGQTRPPDPSTVFAATDAHATGWGDTGMRTPEPDRPVNSTFNGSLLADLRRFEEAAASTEVLAVIAAGIRHATPLILHLQQGRRILALSVFPREQFFRCARDICALAPEELAQLKLVHVELGQAPPILMRTSRFEPLGRLLWLLAMHGGTSDLLAEIAGPARYRVSPSLLLDDAPIDDTMKALLAKMRDRPVALEQLVNMGTLDRTRVCRMLNAVYLQSGLMITRAFQSSWFVA